MSQSFSNKDKSHGRISAKKGAVQKKKTPAANYLEDNRSKSVVQKKVNRTGLPDDLKSGIENLSGYAMDDVKVHYNSSKPAQLNAHAFAQGSHIHLATGQEKHLPHEAWHVVQQKQGRVKPTVQKDNISINDDKGLEHEADVMGDKIVQRKIEEKREVNPSMCFRNDTIQLLRDPNNDWNKILDVYNRYHNDYLHYGGPQGAPPGNLAHWTQKAEVAEARILSEWHGIKHIMAHNQGVASFGANDKTEPDAFGSAHGSDIRHAVEHKFVSGGQDAVADNLGKAMDQLTLGSRAKHIRDSATAIITLKPNSPAAIWVQGGGNPGHWKDKLMAGMLDLHHTHPMHLIPSLHLVIQVDGQPPAFSKRINSKYEITNIANQAAPVEHPNLHYVLAHAEEKGIKHSKEADRLGKKITRTKDTKKLAKLRIEQGHHQAAVKKYEGARHTANALISERKGNLPIAAQNHTMAAKAFTEAAGHEISIEDHASAGYSFTQAGDSYHSAHQNLHSSNQHGHAANAATHSAQSYSHAAVSYSIANKTENMIQVKTKEAERNSESGHSHFRNQNYNESIQSFDKASKIHNSLYDHFHKLGQHQISAHYFNMFQTAQSTRSLVVNHQAKQQQHF